MYEDKKPSVDFSKFSIEDLKVEKELTEKTRQGIFDLIKPLQDQNLQLYTDLEAINNALDAKVLASQEDLDPNWPYLLEETGSTSRIRSKACLKALAALGKGFNEYSGLSVSGYNPVTRQRSLKVVIDKNNEKQVLDVVSAMNVVLPFIKIRTNEDVDDDTVQIKYVGIFEKSLSEHGSYSLAINEELNLYELRMMRYHRPSTLYKAKDLHDLITYVSKNHYYK